MSYILDALKKADKERKRGTVPDLSTVQDPSTMKPEKRSLWPYLVAVALIINAGILIFWFVQMETGNKTTLAKAPPAVKHDIHAKASSPGPSEDRTSHATEQAETAETAPSGTGTLKEKYSHMIQPTVTTRKQEDTGLERQTIPSSEIKKDVSSEESFKNKPQELTAHSKTAADSPVAGKTTTDQQRSFSVNTSESRFRLYELKDLPSTVKDKLPDITISVFVYSDDPSSRIVKINGKTIREGEELTSGLTVENIVPEGVIFHYEDYRFRVRIR